MTSVEEVGKRIFGDEPLQQNKTRKYDEGMRKQR